MPWLGDAGRILDYGVRFTRPVVVDPETGAELTVVAKVGAVDDETARIDLTVTHGGHDGARQGAGARPSRLADARCRRPIPLAQLTTLRTGGTPARMIDAHTTDELVDALARGVGATATTGSSSAAARTSSSATSPSTARSCACAPQGIERMPSPRPGFVRLRVQAGHDWDALVAYAVARGTGRHRGDVGHPRHRRRRAGAEHRRLRAGDRPDPRRGRAARRVARGEVVDGPRRRARARLPHLGAQAPLRIGAAARRGHPVGDARARRGRPRRAADRRRAAAHRARARVPARRCRWRGSAITCSRPGAARAWCSTTPTPTPTAPARSSRTRSCRHPSRGRSPTSARAGRSRPTSTRCSSSRSPHTTATCRRPRRSQSDVKVSAALAHRALRACARASSCRARAPRCRRSTRSR